MSHTYSYTPTVLDEAVATSVGFLRQAPYLAQPERNRNYSEGDIWEAWQHSIAALSEIAFAAMIGYPNFIPSYNTHKSEPDVYGWEVRYGFSQDDGLPPTHMRYSGTIDNNKLPYAFLVGGPEKKFKRSASTNYEGMPITALGWIWGVDAAVPEHYIGDNERGVPQYKVPVSALRPMSEVIRQ